MSIGLNNLGPEDLARLGLGDIGGGGSFPPAASGGVPPALGGMVPGFGTQTTQPPEQFNSPPEAYPGQSQEVPVPNDFWSRLAQGAGAQPFDFHMRRHPSGLEVILGLAAAAGNFKAASAAKKVMSAEEKNARIRQAASELAKQRHELKKQADLRDSIAGLAASKPLQTLDANGNPVYTPTSAAIGKPAVPPVPIPTVGPSGKPVLTPRGAAAGKEPAYPPKAPAGMGARSGGPTTPTTVQAWASQLESGQATWSQVPVGIRNQVADFVAANDMTVLPQKARDAIQSVNGGLNLVDQLEQLSKRVPRGEGVGRFTQGAKNAVGAFTQTNPDAAEYDRLRTNLSNLARAMGERGVLTNQDIDRVLRSIPDLYTSGTLAKRQFATLRNLLGGFKNKSIQTYTTSAAASGADPLGVR